MDTNVGSGAKLSPEHLSMLREGSAISDEVIAARGYRTILEGNELRELGFAREQCRAPGLLIPLHTSDGQQPLCVYRPDLPRVVEDRRKGRGADGTYPQRVIKYEFPKGAGMRVDCPPLCRPRLGDPQTPLWITEGQKKADALAAHGLCAIALLGVWNFKGRNAAGGITVLADFDAIHWRGRDVRIVYDSDLRTKLPVRQALERLIAILQARGAHVAAVYLPPADGGGKQGVDDYLAAGHTVEALHTLVEGPRIEPGPAPARIMLLEREPPTIRQPLALIDGRAYAATWASVRVEQTEGRDRHGQVVRYQPPRTTTEKWLLIVRDDGRIFCDGHGDEVDGDFAALGCEVRLPEAPQADLLWSAGGVTAYRRGGRPDPVRTFRMVAAVIDRFVDFDRSLAGQGTMAEMIACFVLGTYFLPAFTVTGFLWPNGDRGSGKTQLLNAICQMGYLGQVLLAGGSFAALRDLADYGACLAFDDAENLSNPAKSDPDKRALLLAGNRRGATVAVKEPTGPRGWQTRYVSAFCPRLFSAIRLPDPVLASRTIVVPLIRTPDRERANADALDFRLWPHDRRTVVDALWALALAHLPKLPAYEARVNEAASLVGRNLEPWRAILAVALWLEEQGVTGLFQRMNRLSVTYQGERAGLEPQNRQAVVLAALWELLAQAPGARAGPAAGQLG